MRIIVLPLICLGLLGSFGCSSEASRYPVSGTVTINGAPAALTYVTFVAVNPSTPTSSGGSAVTDESGNFSLNTGKTPGLLPGDYKVVFQQSLINGKPSLNGSRGKKSAMLPGETEGVPDDYMSPDSTPIQVTVGKNMAPCQFEIKK
jgi:hypothetical protein